MDINTEEFISAVQHRTAIWQSKHLQHLNRAAINKLWGEIKQLFSGSNGSKIKSSSMFSKYVAKFENDQTHVQ